MLSGAERHQAAFESRIGQLSFITNFGTGRVYPQFLDERNFIRLIGRSAEPIQINLLVICIVIIGIGHADQKQFERLMHIYTYLSHNIILRKPSLTEDYPIFFHIYLGIAR